MVYPVFQNGNTNILIRGIDLSQTYNKLALRDVTPHAYNEDKFFYGNITLSDGRCRSVSQQRFHVALLFRMARASGPRRITPTANQRLSESNEELRTERGCHYGVGQRLHRPKICLPFTSTIAQEMVYLSRIIYHVLLL